MAVKRRTKRVYRWISIDKKVPEGTEAVVIFNPGYFKDKDYCGLPVVTSNPAYVRMNAKSQGFTHWCRLPYPLPKIL